MSVPLYSRSKMSLIKSKVIVNPTQKHDSVDGLVEEVYISSVCEFHFLTCWCI